MSDRMRTIKEAAMQPGGRLHLVWSDDTKAMIDLPDERSQKGTPMIGEWGHSIEWPDGTEWSADRLWLDTLTALGRDDARQFLEWRMRHGLSLSAAADALGLARRTVAYYSNGDRPVPKAILLACRGWEAGKAFRNAA